MNRLNYTAYTGKAGVYCITNTVNSKVYIGSAVDLYSRNNYHLNALKNNSHSNSHLQSAYNKYGEDYFVMSVEEIFHGDNEEELRLLENKYQQYHNALDRRFGYNYVEELGYTRVYSEELKKRMSENSVDIRPVISYNPTTDEIKMYDRRTGIDTASSSGICNTMKSGHLYKGRMWFNVEDYISDEDIRHKNKEREARKRQRNKSASFTCLDLYTGVYYDSINECERALQIPRKSHEFKQRVECFGNRKSTINKIILNVETGIYYKSIAEAAKYNNVCKTHLGKQLRINNGVFRNLKQV